MCPALICYDNRFELGFIASPNRIAYEVMHGKHGMLLGDTKARKVRTFFVLNQLAFEVS
jgi:hypothetical protein